ncbi:MAG TPA: hypothetical protein VNY73_09205 [Bacteroidia bacterium]|jgi:hypothetical protein|nr:hypothetical protein [Bacteroidia bacterium]
MRKFQRYISFFLLSVFLLVILPTPFLHDIFSDHADQKDNYCHFYHKDLGKHIEEQEHHCDLFKTQTPLYDAVKANFDLSLPLSLVTEYKVGTVRPHYHSLFCILPARAPPVA